MSRRAVTGWTWTRSASTTLQVLREHHFTTDPNPRPPLPSSPCPCRPLPPLTLTRLPPEEEELVPTVFRWEHGGRQVYITGTFNNWEKQVCPRASLAPTGCSTQRPPLCRHVDNAHRPPHKHLPRSKCTGAATTSRISTT
mmetsp:Transcript_23722/g.63796  ORF Transcript_23722/g.63796 Transcript_23722/m.63796 type:complete len:140 (-) Transcript_23722:464-883(-)